MKQSLVKQIRQRLKEAAEQEPEKRARALLAIQSDLNRFRKNPHIDKDMLIDFDEDVERRLSNIDDHVTLVQQEAKNPSWLVKLSRIVMVTCPWMNDSSQKADSETNNDSPFLGD